MPEFRLPYLHISKRSQRAFFLSIGMILCFIQAQGQAYPYEVKKKDFIRYDLNQMSFPGDSLAYEPLYEKIDRLIFDGEGQINVVHIGGSHIQADIISDRMRQRLQTFYPGNQGARGLLFPFKMAKTNNPYNYLPEWTGNWESCRNVQRKRDCLLGLTGISVTTRDTLSSLSLSFRGKNYPQYEFNTVRVFHDQGADSYSLRVKEFISFDQMDGGEISQVVEKLDYTLHPSDKGYTEIRFKEHFSRLDLEFVKTAEGQNHFTLYGISLDNQDPGFIYHAIGINGASVPSYLRCQLFEKHMAAIQPDLVILSVGINDANQPAKDFSPARYERHYDSLLTWIRRAAPETRVLFTTNNDSYYRRRYANKNAIKVRETMLRLAKKYSSMAVWDMFGVMGGLGSIRKWELEGLARRDKIHFTADGYRLMGDLLFNALLKDYEGHLSRKFQGGTTE